MKTKIKNKQERGITLVALVVTIVVLLILAGISLNLVLGQNGIISRAQDARNQTTEGQVNTEKAVNALTDEMEDLISENENSGNGGNSGGSQTTVENVVIPDGYYYVGGTKAKGIVISDNVADKELDKGKEDVRRDLAGNQWVWVPVETPSSLYTTVDAGIALAGSTGVKTTKYTNSEIISGTKRGLPGSTASREPDILTSTEWGDSDESAKTAGFSSLVNMAETMKNDYEEMIASLEKYKGFYIGRYELSANGEKTGATQTCRNNVNWYTLYKNCTTLAKEGTKAKTRMIWGLQWDATCNWLASSGFDIKDSSAWGNYNGIEKMTGSSEMYKANNIYDFAGNCLEFTQEVTDISYRISRGGKYDESGSALPASCRYGITPAYPLYTQGARPALYMIP